MFTHTAPEMTYKAGQISVCASSRLCSVNIFTTPTLRDRGADVGNTWHVIVIYSMGPGNKVLGSGISNFAPTNASKVILCHLICIADCNRKTFFMSENRLNGCQIFGRFLKNESDPVFGFLPGSVHSQSRHLSQSRLTLTTQAWKQTLPPSDWILYYTSANV